MFLTFLDGSTRKGPIMGDFNLTYPPTVRDQRPELTYQLGRAQALADIVRRITFNERMRYQLNLTLRVEYVHASVALEGNPCPQQEVRTILQTEHGTNPPGREILATDRLLNSLRCYFPAEYNGQVTEALILAMYELLAQGMHRTFTPALESEQAKRIRDLVAYLQSDATASLHPVLRAALAHGILAAAKPFAWGNGLVARAIESYMLHCAGYSDTGFYLLAGYYLQHTTQYHREIQKIQQGDVDGFLDIVVLALVTKLSEGAENALSHYAGILYKDYAKEMVRFGKISERAASLAELLWMLGAIPEKSIIKKEYSLIAQLYERVQSERTIRRDLDKLAACGLIHVRQGEVSANMDRLRGLGDLSSNKAGNPNK